MMFDYKEAQKKVMENLDILNINGRNQARLILEYLEVCPFFEVIADHMKTTVDNIYQKMKYYLGEDEWKALREDVRARRTRDIDAYKKSRSADLYALDDERDARRNRDRDT